VALRVRRIGDRFVQTLKTAPGSGGPAIARGEWERAVPGERPELDGVADKRLRRLLDDGRLADRLERVFETDIERRVLPLSLGGAELELALDVGEIRTPTGNLPVCEAEIELKSGAVRSVYEVADAVRRAVPAAVEPLSKSERAFALMSPGGPPARRAEPVKLADAADVGDAFLAIARGCIGQLRANAAAVAAGEHPEGMHQLRVAIRRLRSAFGAFAEALPAGDRRRFARHLKAIADACGRARERDVFLDEILGAAGRRLGSERALVAVRAAAARERDRAWARARAALAAPRFSDTLLALEGWLETGGWRRLADAKTEAPAREFARSALRRLHRRVLRAGDGIAGLPEPELHQLRLRAKKLRYAAEFFGSLFPAKAAKRYVDALAAVQDRLGALNDGATVRGVLAAVGTRLRAGERAEFDRGAALLLGWSAAHVAAEIERLPRTWRRLEDARRFWK
jgi:inorganic triphosphatase YgiF